MKIRRIRLAAFGPFTDVTIDLPDTGPDFHMLFGPNEAGKSSALRALRHMLFGIPARTADNFLHGYATLRVGADLVNRNGDKIKFLRRKGNAKTLRGQDDETVLDDDALAPFLGGVSADVFEKMFAIGHEDLIRGGEEIISGKGRVGEALFAAGGGLIRLHNVQKDLEDACGALFKPSGSTPSINRILKAVKKARKNQKAALLMPKAWQDHDGDLRDAQARLENVKGTLGTLQQRRARLERIKAALPLIARKKEIDAALVAFRGVPDLADDFGERRRDAEKDLKIATRDDDRCREIIKKIGKEIDALPIPVALLENAAAVESLQQMLGKFNSAQKDRPGLEGRMHTLQKQAADLLDEIGMDMSSKASGHLKLPPSTVSEIQKLGKAYERLAARQESAAAQHRKLKNRFRQLTDQRNALPAPLDVPALDHAMQSAQKAGPIETQLADMCTTIATLESELTRFLERQTLWNGSLVQIDALPLPSRENVDHFDNRFDASHRRLEKLRENKVATEEEIVQTRADIQAIDFSREVPTESDLDAARDRRNKGWGLIRKLLEGKLPSGTPSRNLMNHFDCSPDLPGAFEKSMRRADHIADRLRREADQVTRKGLLEARRQKLQQSLAGVDAALDKALVMHSELQDEWQKIWAPADITPQTPKEMRGWLSEIAMLRGKLADLRSKKVQADVLATQLAAIRSGLLTALDDAGFSPDANDSLVRLIKTARSHINSQRELEAGIASADKMLINLKAELEESASAQSDLTDALSRWQAGWEKSVKKIGLDADASPTAALAVIESVREARSKISEADVLGKRIAGIDRDASEFTARVGDLVDALAPDLKPESQVRAAELLNSRLTTARKNESKQLGLLAQLESAEKEQAEAQRRIFECETLIEALCNDAHCTGAEALAETEKRAQKRNALTRDLKDIEQQLRNVSAGATVDAFIAEAASMDADSIVPELQALGDEMEGLEKDRSELEQNIGALKNALEQMDGRSAAAMHAERTERLLAGLELDVETYARLKIASVILSRTVEQYREKHQGPLISRASELFARMTLGNFSRLRADYDDKGNPVLVGIRAESGVRVSVDGMSDGTADQLYLALRLASLEQYLENNEPLPFVVDDILLRFDDERALATLAVLSGLSEKTQVLFFTHHQHLVALAENSKAAGLKFRLHRLGR